MRAARLKALEQASVGSLWLHYPEDGDDHAAIRASLKGKRVGVVVFPGLNDAAAAAFGGAR